MSRPKLYTPEEIKQRRRDSSLKWMHKNKKYVIAKSIAWAKNNPLKVNANTKRHYAKVKDSFLFRINRLWYFMISRCYNVADNRYSSYGARGIAVCDLWRYDRNLFIEWALNNGYQLGLTIDRIDNNGNYEPSNCRFTTQKVQSNNTRSNVIIEYNGEEKTLTQWAEYFNIPKATLWWRYKQGHSFEKMFYKKHIQSHKRLILN